MECLIASVVLAFAVAAIATALSAGANQAQSGVDDARGARLAEMLMEEVLALPYADADASAGQGARSSWDQLNDYTSFTESGGVADQAGVRYGAEFQHYTRSVRITWETLTLAGLSGSVPGATVVVTVRDTLGGGSWTLTAFVPAP